MNLTGVHLGSYWMGKNDVVYLMAQELNKISRTKLIDTKIYDANSDGWYIEEKLKGHRFAIRWINHNKFIKMIGRHKPDYVVVNAGGMGITKETSAWLKDKGIVSVGIELSDPDVFEDNGNVYGQYFDLFYTNSLHSLKESYPKKAKYHWLPFAASPTLHRPIANVPKRYDVVIVGHARPERIELVKTLRKFFTVGTFGSGWGDNSHEVHGQDHVRAINSGKIYLSFAKTYDGYTNVKVGLLEAAACKTCIITANFEELSYLYTYGVDLVGYVDETSITDVIRYYLDNDVPRLWIANNCYLRTLNEHTWENRWKGVICDIKKVRESQKFA